MLLPGPSKLRYLNMLKTLAMTGLSRYRLGTVTIRVPFCGHILGGMYHSCTRL